MAITRIHNNKKKYYELLSSIVFENGYDINGCGFVTLSVPFKWTSDAVRKEKDNKKIVDNITILRYNTLVRRLIGIGG